MSWLKDRIGPGWFYSLHFFTSAVIVILLHVYLKIDAIHGVGFALCLGVLKELFDILRGGDADVLDIVYNMAGCFTGWLLCQ